MTNTRRFLSIWVGLSFTVLGALGLAAAAAPQQARKTGPAKNKGTTAPKEPPRPYYDYDTRRYLSHRSLSDFVLYPAVVKELKLSPEAQKKIGEARRNSIMSSQNQQIDQASRNAYQHWRDAEFGGDPAKIAVAEQEFARVRRVQAEADAARDRAALAALTPAQRKRMVQIFLRYQGVRALARPEIGEKAGLTENQIAEFQKILADRERFLHLQSVAKSRDPAAGKLANRRNELLTKSIEAHSKGQELNKDDNEEFLRLLKEGSRRAHLYAEKLDRFERGIDAKLSKILTRYQRARFARMLGPDFDIHQLNLRYVHQEELKAKSKAAEKSKSGVEK